jgi:hypothetical protein
MNKIYICTNLVYCITMLFLLYSIYVKMRDLSSLLNVRYFNEKIVKIIFIPVIISFLVYFTYDNCICYSNYDTNNLNTKFIKLSLGLILLILKLIINKIKDNKLDLSSLLKYFIAIIFPVVIPSFMDYILEFENNLHSVLKSLIRGCVHLLAISLILFSLVPALLQCQFLDLRVGHYLILGLSNNVQNIGNINKFKWNINIMDNTGNSAGISSISSPQSGATSGSIPQGEGASSSAQQAGVSSSSTIQEEGSGKREAPEDSSSKPVFKKPSTRNMTEYDSDTDTTQTWIITRARRINKQNLFRLQNMYNAYAADNPDLPIDEHYDSSSEIIRRYVDYRNKKTDGKISIADLNYLISRKKWNILPYDELCELSDDVDYELNENRKTLKWTKNDLLQLMVDRNKTKNLEEKEEMNKEIQKYIEAIKSYKETELSLRKEQLALNFRKAGITPTAVSSITEEVSEK